jgi:bacterioferritin-associated ferredoxin
MYVCICKAVNVRRVREAAASGAVSLRDLTRELGLGTSCGKCVPTARELLNEMLNSQRCHDAEPALTQVQAAS